MQCVYVLQLTLLDLGLSSIPNTHQKQWNIGLYNLAHKLA